MSSCTSKVIALALLCSGTSAFHVPSVRSPLRIVASSSAAAPSPPASVVPPPDLEAAAAGTALEAAGGGAALERLNRVSNFASFLCAIDCTVFPLLLTLLPLVSAASAWVNVDVASAWLHRASHAAALWFVGPVGGAAVVANVVQHRKWLVGLWGASGIALILLANIHLPHVLLGWHVPHAVEHFLHAKHTVINVVGCALLLSSQRYSHNLLEASGKCCDHGHGHSHSHSH